MDSARGGMVGMLNTSDQQAMTLVGLVILAPVLVLRGQQAHWLLLGSIFASSESASRTMHTLRPRFSQA